MIIDHKGGDSSHVVAMKSGHLETKKRALPASTSRPRGGAALSSEDDQQLKHVKSLRRAEPTRSSVLPGGAPVSSSESGRAPKKGT